MALLVVVIALAALGGIAGCCVAWRRWRAEQRELARVRGTFARYVAPSVVDAILSRKDERVFTGRAVRATILVCRIRDFARFIEPLSPEQTLRYLNEFYALAGTAIQRHRGIIDSFLGDGMVGVFGVPLENPTQEDDALQAALDIVRHVVAMRDRWAKQHRKPFTVGIGVNTGEVIAGDAGFRDRREFTVVGSEATFAHRLQESAFELNAFIVASRSTCASLTTEYNLVPLSKIPVPGVRRLLDAFVVRGRTGGTERFTVPVDALVETTIETSATTPETAPGPAAAVPAAPVAAAAAASAAPAAAAQLVPDPPAPPPPAAPPEPPLARPLRRTAANADTAVFGPSRVPDGWIFPPDEAVSILPDPPPPRATYEDSAGPPHQL